MAECTFMTSNLPTPALSPPLGPYPLSLTAQVIRQLDGFKVGIPTHVLLLIYFCGLLNPHNEGRKAGGGRLSEEGGTLNREGVEAKGDKKNYREKPGK